MKKLLFKIVNKWFLPQIQEKAVVYIESEEIQKKFVKLASERIKLEGLSEEAEIKLLNAAYDAAQELAKENIKHIDLDKIMENL
ncbi:MAG: hypothetical protein ACOC2U_02480 [bacterium]